MGQSRGDTDKPYCSGLTLTGVPRCQSPEGGALRVPKVIALHVLSVPEQLEAPLDPVDEAILLHGESVWAASVLEIMTVTRWSL